MPQVDLETLVCGGGDGEGEVSCDTLISSSSSDSDPNLPPESIELPIQDSITWVDLNVVYDREDSAKETTNPKSHNSSNRNHSRSNSQRLSGTNLKVDGPIIGLPNRIKHVSGSISRRPPTTNGRIFPKKKSGRSGKSAVPESEPTSPKVSCFGKVLSDRERERCRLAHRRSPDTGCWAGFTALLKCGGRDRMTAVEDGTDVASKNILENERNIPSAEEVKPVPGLGGMQRFASGRRAASWGGDVEEEEDGHVSVAKEGVWGRRSVEDGS